MRLKLRLVSAGLAMLVSCAPALAQAPAPPPRSIGDITAILDQQKPDPALIADRQRIAESAPPAGASGQQLAQFHLQRAQARFVLGRLDEAIADAEQAYGAAAPLSDEWLGALQNLAAFNPITRDYAKAIAILRNAAPQLAAAPYGPRITLQRHLVRSLIGLGELAESEREMSVFEALVGEARSKTAAAEVELQDGAWQGDFEFAHGIALESLGKWAEAEAAYAKAEAGFRDAIAKQGSRHSTRSLISLQQSADIVVTSASRVKREQGRLAESEVDARRALIGQLSLVGKYHPLTAGMCQALASILRDQGRFAEYESMARASLEILQTLGTRPTSVSYVVALTQVANALRLQLKWREAMEVFRVRNDSMAGWNANRSAPYRFEIGYILTLYTTGELKQGLEAATGMVELYRRRRADNFDYAVAEGLLGIGLAQAARTPEALAAFRRSVSLLTGKTTAGDDDGIGAANRRQRLTARIYEAYIALLAQAGNTADAAELVNETFPLADALRGHSVAAAVAASSARAGLQDRELAEMARREQDLRKQLAAGAALLSSALSLPPGQRNDATIAALRQEIGQKREEHRKIGVEIAVRFPSYADLVDPKPASVEQLRTALRADEAFLSFYFGAERSFVWAVPKTGPAQFAVLDIKAGELEAKVKRLREALDPSVTSIADIPAFDLAVAYELYSRLLKPVEAAWKPARNLVVATNGALGLLPLGVLPTEPTALPPDPGTAFAAYRRVPWLARTHAVTMMPSAATFRTLRQLPAPPGGRAPMVGFGDPIFSPGATTVPTTPVDRRGVTLVRRSAPQTQNQASADLTVLPPLPDTADELKSIAGALHAGMGTLHLGKEASEEKVAGVDLAKFRVVAFATHGLVAGELDGLDQPALALSSPLVTGGKGDGLLTLEEILGLKLDADWVVLSACNTGAGDGAGAEAASGLGRAFFYAGTRAILVTNWSVHSQSARDLVTDLFRRQAADAKLTRAEALRRAMMALADEGNFQDASGKAVFTYAHPLFWAPYSIIGDGG